MPVSIRLLGHFGHLVCFFGLFWVLGDHTLLGPARFRGAILAASFWQLLDHFSLGSRSDSPGPSKSEGLVATWKTRNCPLASLAGQASGCIDDRSIQQLGFSEGKALLKLVCRSSRQAEEEPRGRPGSLAVLLAPPWPPCSLPSLSRALLKVSILAALKDTVPNMPGLKWIFNPALAKGEHAVKLTDEVMGCLEMPLSSPRGPHRKTEGSLPLGFFLLCEEESKRDADEDTDAALTDEPETRDDELLDPLAVQALPEVDQGVFAQGLAAPAPLGPAPLRSWLPLGPIAPI